MAEFDEAYVKKLRDEAASWRTKFRELEAQQSKNLVEVELAKQGLQADPGWVNIEEGQSVEDAVAAFATKYPHLKKQESRSVSVDENDFDFTPQPPKTAPKPLTPTNPNTNIPKPVKATRITGKNINEIKKDPVARAKVRDAYRALLQKSSNQPGE